MRRILQVLGDIDYGGGISMVVMNYYKEIDRSKVLFDFLLTGRPDPGKDQYISEAERYGARMFFRPHRRQNIRKNITCLYKVFKNNADISGIHVHSNSEWAFIDLAVAWLCGIRIRIIHGHSSLSPTFVARRIRSITRLFATHFCAPTKIIGMAIFGNTISENRLFCIPNAIPIDAFRFDATQRNFLRNTLDLTDRFVLLNVGRLAPEKNQRFLLDIMRELRVPKAVLLIVGGGDPKADLRKYAEDNGLFDIVRFLGVREDVGAILSAADMFLLPSFYEGQPVALIEAQTAGLPCLASNHVPGTSAIIPELVRFLPIDQGVQAWVDMITKTSIQLRNCQDSDFRAEAQQKMKQSIYNISTATKLLEELYYNNSLQLRILGNEQE